MDWINNAGKLAGSISAVIALLALVLIKPIKKAAARRMEAEEAQQRFQAEVLAKLDAVRAPVAGARFLHHAGLVPDKQKRAAMHHVQILPWQGAQSPQRPL